MDIDVMIAHYRKIFKHDRDVFDWVMHDLKQMGLSDLEHIKCVDELIRKLKLEP